MRTRTLHLIFGAIAAICLAALLQAVLAQRAAIAYNQALAQPDAAAGRGQPAAALAHGVRLAGRGEVRAAQQAFQQALQQDDPALRRMARYNLGNLHLRQALAMRVDDPQAVPLAELAKQYYRQVLAEEPAHWAARYNLERALRLQPEGVTWISVKDRDQARERSVTASRLEPGELP